MSTHSTTEQNAPGVGPRAAAHTQAGAQPAPEPVRHHAPPPVLAEAAPAAQMETQRDAVDRPSDGTIGRPAGAAVASDLSPGQAGAPPYTAGSHRLPDAVVASVEAAAAEIKPLVDEVRAKWEVCQQRDADHRAAALEVGRLLKRLLHKCEQVRLVPFARALAETGIPSPTAYRYLRAAEGLDRLAAQKPDVDHTDRSLADLTYVGLTGMEQPRTGQRSSFPTPQLHDKDAPPQFVRGVPFHPDARWSESFHTEMLLQHVRLPEGPVLDPCVGAGAVAKVLQGAGKTVVTLDIIDYGFAGTAPWDMRCAKRPPYEFSSVVANIPWRTHDGFGPRKLLARMCEWQPELICLLVPATMIGSLNLPRCRPGYRLSQAIVFSKSKSRGTNPATGRKVQEAWEMSWICFTPADGATRDWMVYVK